MEILGFKLNSNSNHPNNNFAIGNSKKEKNYFTVKNTHRANEDDGDNIIRSGSTDKELIIMPRPKIQTGLDNFKSNIILKIKKSNTAVSKLKDQVSISI